MRILTSTGLLVVSLGASPIFAQPEAPPDGARRGPPGAARASASELLVTRMLAFDKDANGELLLEEVTDARLHRLFRRADADDDGTVTKDELTAVAAAIAAEFPNAGQRRRGPGGPGGLPRGSGGPPPRGPGRAGNRPPPEREQ